MRAKSVVSSHLRRHFRTSATLHWAHPNSLKSDQIKRELVRLSLPISSDQEANLSTLCKHIGGFDPVSGLTTDLQLLERKRKSEESARQIPERTNFSCELLIESRHYKKFLHALTEEQKEMVIATETPYRVKISGRYGEVMKVRSVFVDIQQELCGEGKDEIIFVIPKSLAPKLTSSVLLSMKEQSQAKFHLYKLKATDTYLLVVQGSKVHRMQASRLLETTFKDELNLQTYHPISRKSRKKKSSIIDDIVSTREELTVSLYLDPSVRELLIGNPTFLDCVANDTQCTISTSFDDPSRFRPYEIVISGGEENVTAARSLIDDLVVELRKSTTCLLLKKQTYQAIQPFWRNLVDHIFTEHGVKIQTSKEGGDTVIHLTGPLEGRREAMSTFDYHIIRENYVSEVNHKQSLATRRATIKNINLSAYGIGGLGSEMKAMFRRTFASRCVSEHLRREMGIKHTKGVLLYGPPGTGKSLIARNISGILGCDNPKIINAPEIESKWVGEAEKNIRALFEDAQKEFAEKGSESGLHVIIFDELDAIAKKRGGAHAKSRDGALNQMLCCLDGINDIDNVLVFGLTNRMDSLDPALTRPGRLEVHVEIGLPNAESRLEILNIHTKAMRENRRLDSDIDLEALAQYADGFSGADLAGFIRNAQALALESFTDEENVLVTQDHMEQALFECRQAKLKSVPKEEKEMETGLLLA